MRARTRSEAATATQSPRLGPGGRAGRTAVAVRRRRLVAGCIAIVCLAIAAWALAVAHGRGPSNPPPPGLLTVRAGPEVIARVSLRSYVAGREVRSEALARRVGALAAGFSVIRTGAATIHYRYSVAALRAAIAHVGPQGGAIDLARRPVSSSIDAPIVRQTLPNDCEATSLQILLATVGRRADQLALQRQLPRSGPLDPIGTGPSRVWGDPAVGFVGRAEGGGAAGGFGVYERPVRALAARHGVALRDLSRAPFAAVRSRILEGHAVMAWVGLSDGPYATWRTPGGRPVTVNYGEHAVVVNGIGPDGTLSIVNPLTGAREQWRSRDFRIMWARLGRRALST